MDVRLSPEQVALRDSAAQVVDRLGLHVVADLDDTERVGKLDAAVTASGWRELRTESDEGGPWASAVEVAVVAEELGRGLADVPFIGPDHGGRPATVGRGDAHGHTRDDRARTRPFRGRPAAVAVACPRAGWPWTRRGAVSALALVPGRSGSVSGLGSGVSRLHRRRPRLKGST